MKTISFDFVKNNIGTFGVILLLAGLFVSPFLLSISFAFILLQLFFDRYPYGYFRALLSNKISILFLLLFLWYFAGIFYTDSLTDFFADIKMKLPLLVMAFAAASKILVKKQNLVFIFITLNVFVFLTGTASFINYLMHKKELDMLVLQGKPIPIITGMNHIYFSVILAFSVLSSIVFYFEGLFKSYLKIVNIITGISGLIFLHFISAKTGLFAFYTSLFVLFLWLGFERRKILVTLTAMIVLAMFAFISVKYVGVLNKRWQNITEDIRAYKEGTNINYYSLSTRIEYWDKTFKVFLKAPLTGVGSADVQKVSMQVYEEEGSRLWPESRRNAHNQFLQILAATGLIGFCILILIFYFSFARIFRNKDYALLAFLVVIFCTFLVESFLERQAGMAFFSFFLPLMFVRNDN